MTCRRSLGIVTAILVVSGSSSAWAQDAAAAAKASPELVSALGKELSVTPEQAAGAAGALFGVAKSRLSATDFGTVSAAVPGMDALLKAAPSGGAVGTSGALSKIGGSAAGLATATSAFKSLGISPDLVSKAIPVLTSFVSSKGGANVAGLLAGALK